MRTIFIPVFAFLAIVFAFLAIDVQAQTTGIRGKIGGGPTSQQTIINEGFENGQDGWTFAIGYPSPGLANEITDKVSHSGTHSFHADLNKLGLYNTDPYDGYPYNNFFRFSGLSQDLPSQNGTYNLRFFYRYTVTPPTNFPDETTTILAYLDTATSTNSTVGGSFIFSCQYGMKIFDYRSPTPCPAPNVWHEASLTFEKCDNFPIRIMPIGFEAITGLQDPSKISDVTMPFEVFIDDITLTFTPGGACKAPTVAPTPIQSGPTAAPPQGVSTQGLCGIGEQDVAKFTSRFYGCALSLSGGVSLLAILFGAYLLLTSKGKLSQVQEGKAWIAYAIIGLILVILAYIIISVVSNNILKLPGFG